MNPGRKPEERITEITRIRDEDLEGAPELDEVFPKLLEFLGDLPLLGHRILFDYSLKKAAVDRKVNFENAEWIPADRQKISTGTATSESGISMLSEISASRPQGVGRREGNGQAMTTKEPKNTVVSLLLCLHSRS